MSLLDHLEDAERWEAFYRYKTSLARPKDFTAALRAFIDRQGYLPVCAAIRRGDRFPLPRRREISKQGTEKKRVVYTYPPEESIVLKLLTHLLLRQYDDCFDSGLYSFRPGRTAKDAVRRLTHIPGIWEMYAYKADIRNYFNAIPVPRLLPMLEEVTAADPALFSFLRALLEEPEVCGSPRPPGESKGIMAGTPLSAFYANLYLRDLDRHFASLGLPYARYSDDIILFAPDRRELEAHRLFLHHFLDDRALAINPDKEFLTAPGEGWTFLGFLCREGAVDIAPATVKKLKGKMRRKARALRRWSDRTELTGDKAAAAFLRVFNRKLLEGGGDHELSWRHWFFPVLTTAESLGEIDRYAQDCLRFLCTGTRTKARYAARYEDLKALGYRSLVHAYYRDRRETRSTGDRSAL